MTRTTGAHGRCAEYDSVLELLTPSVLEVAFVSALRAPLFTEFIALALTITDIDNLSPQLAGHNLVLFFKRRASMTCNSSPYYGSCANNSSRRSLH